MRDRGPGGRLRVRLGAVPLLVFMTTSACTMVGSPALVSPPPAPESIADAVPRVEPPARQGNMAEYELGGRRYQVRESSYGYDERGVASWYGNEFHGRPTSSGEAYDMNLMTAAHRTLPIPSYVEVTNLANGRTAILRVNDRGPFHDPDRRIIDVSYAAAIKLGLVASGTAPVRVRAVEPWQRRTP